MTKTKIIYDWSDVSEYINDDLPDNDLRDLTIRSEYEDDDEE